MYQGRTRSLAVLALVVLLCVSVALPAAARTLQLGSWTAVTSPEPDLNRLFVEAASPAGAWAAGEGGMILQYQDPDWVLHPNSPTNQSLWFIEPVAADDGWALGNNGTILRYDGADWISATSPVTTHLYSLAMVPGSNNMDGFIVGDSGTILRWNGTAWSPVDHGQTSNGLGWVTMVSGTEGWAVGDRGTILHYQNGAWLRVPSPVPNTLGAVEMLSPTDGWIVGGGGTILRYNGTDWVEYPHNLTTADLWSIDFVSDLEGWIVGGRHADPGSGTPAESVILHWDGTAWSSVTNPTTELLWSVSMESSTNGWAAGDNGTLLNYTAEITGVVASFSASPTLGLAPLSVSFTNTSAGDFDTSEWDFGDGSAVSAETNPTHVYTDPGTYTVTLTVTGPGGTDTLERVGYITVESELQADFSASTLSGAVPLTVTLTNLSTPGYTGVAWDFGDGSPVSTEISTTHVYTVPGTYELSLTAEWTGATDTVTRTVTAYDPAQAIVADFSGTPRAGNAPLTVTFTNLSTGGFDSATWDFGDGGTSTEMNPVHTYTTAGTYDVSLTMTGPAGTDSVTMAGYVVVDGGEPPTGQAIYMPLLMR